MKNILYTILYILINSSLPSFPLDQKEVQAQLANPDRQSWLLMVFGIPLGMLIV
jgi:hypothetical protein